jgi:hypothetical protein
MEEPITTSGVQFLKRVQGGDAEVMNQYTETVISADKTTVGYESTVSGRHRAIVFTEPAHQEVFQRLDEAQRAAAIADRPPVAEPERLPVDAPDDGRPPNSRSCWLCEGRGQVMHAFRHDYDDCAACNGRGWIAVDDEAAPED